MKCLEINPCWGWLNSNEEDRKKTTQRAKELDDVYRRIEAEQNFQNFKFVFYTPPWREMFAEYGAAGYPLSNLIEKVDGFHPSQAANAMFAEKFFQWMEEEHPEMIGPLNPNNAEIDA